MIYKSMIYKSMIYKSMIYMSMIYKSMTYNVDLLKVLSDLVGIPEIMYHSFVVCPCGLTSCVSVGR